ncbi:hypothetical protein TKK_0013707 [Trichogramma kaykai]
MASIQGSLNLTAQITLHSSCDLSRRFCHAHVSKTVELESYNKFLTNTRLWRSKNKRRPALENTGAFVFKLSSPSIRDQCMMNVSKLASVSSSKLFGKANGKIKLLPVWPNEIFSLLSKAYDASHVLNYAQPTMRNQTVFMRETNGSKPIPISNEEP